VEIQTTSEKQVQQCVKLAKVGTKFRSDGVLSMAVFSRDKVEPSGSRVLQNDLRGVGSLSWKTAVSVRLQFQKPM
jgi:hypothetical protein